MRAMIFLFFLFFTINVYSQTPVLNAEETEIPVVLEGTKKIEGNRDPLMRISISIAILSVLGFGFFIFSKKYLKTSKNKEHANQIKILSQHFLGPKKSLAVIRVAGESILIGVTEQNISLIKQLSLLDEDIPEETPRNFKNVLKNKSHFDNPHNDSQDEFSISGIKDIVQNRLKNMRTIE